MHTRKSKTEIDTSAKTLAQCIRQKGDTSVEGKPPGNWARSILGRIRAVVELSPSLYARIS